MEPEKSLEGFKIDTTLPPPARVPRVATFYALYPETLGLADGTTFAIALGQPIRGFGKIAMHLKDGEAPFWLDPKLSQWAAVSVRFHRAIHDRNFLQERESMLMSVVDSSAGSAFPEFERSLSDPDTGEARPSPSHDPTTGKEYTVVEMSTQLVMPEEEHWQACEPNSYVMGPTLTRCIEGLIRVVDAYRFAENIPMPSPARERLGPAIAAVTRAADPSQGGWDSPAQYVVNSFATQGARHFIVGTQSPETLKRMAEYVTLTSRGHPSVAVINLQADLDNAMFDGNFRVVLMFAYTASEILLDLSLMGMLFEEGKSAAEGVTFFAKPLKTRLLAEYHDRLGGAWNPRNSDAVSGWLRSVREVRNRVAHAGYLPDYEEARIAREAYFSLRLHLLDRLASRPKKYPFTAGLQVSPAGFERRGITSKSAREATRTAFDRLDDFLAWRDDLIRLRA
jgi:hypothetical protein